MERDIEELFFDGLVNEIERITATNPSREYDSGLERGGALPYSGQYPHGSGFQAAVRLRGGSNRVGRLSCRNKRVHTERTGHVHNIRACEWERARHIGKHVIDLSEEEQSLIYERLNEESVEAFVKTCEELLE